MEVSKLLLSFDRSDPMGVLFCIDFHALRAREYDFLLNLVDKYEGSHQRDLSLYPNFLYSVALAKWYQEKDGGGTSGAFSDTSSAELLSQAISTYPFALKKLLNKLADKGMATMAPWTSVIEKPLFKNSLSGNSASLDHLVSLFVEKHYELWKDSEIQSWMVRAAKSALGAEEDNAGGAAADWRALQGELFPPSEVNEYRHISLADFSDHLNQIPEDALLQMGQQQPQHHQMAPPGGALGQTVHLSGAQLREGNALAVLLQSLLPWVSVDTSTTPPNNQGDDGSDQ